MQRQYILQHLFCIQRGEHNTLIKKNWNWEYQKPGLDSVKDLWEGYALDPEASLQEVVGEHEQVNKLGQLLQNLKVVVNKTDCDEHASFIAQKPIDVEMSGLMWWVCDEQRQQWPRLSRMAIDILSIPAMSDKPERVFFGGRRIVTWERAQLGPEMIEKLDTNKDIGGRDGLG